MVTPPRGTLALLLALALLAPALAGAPTATSAGMVGWSTGYYPGWQQSGYPPSAIPWNSLTHLVHFSLLTGSARDGSIDTTAHGLTPQRMQAAVAEAHTHGKQILIGIGGAEDDNWDAACNTTNRAKFIANLIGVMRRYGYDGIDLDIEQDWQSPAHLDYIACVAGIRAALDAITPKPLLTEPGDPDWQAYMLVQVWPYLDQINLMDYWRDATAISAGLNNYTSLGIPKTLLGVGIGIADDGTDGVNPADCGAKVQAAVTGGYGGVMVWTVPADADLHGGQTPCFNAIAPYVAASSPTPRPSPTPSHTPGPSPTSGPSPSPNPLPSAGLCGTRFGDVHASDTACVAIEALAGRGVIKGCDQDATPPLFCPNDLTLRAQMAALMVRAMAWGSETPTTPFSDRCAPANPQNCIDGELWTAVGILAAKGVAQGYADGATCAPAAAPCYAPRDNVTSAQAISLIARAMVEKGYWTAATTDDGTVYPNIPAASGHRLDFVTYTQNVGPVPGTASATQDFAAWDQATRGRGSPRRCGRRSKARSDVVGEVARDGRCARLRPRGVRHAARRRCATVAGGPAAGRGSGRGGDRRWPRPVVPLDTVDKSRPPS